MLYRKTPPTLVAVLPTLKIAPKPRDRERKNSIRLHSKYRHNRVFVLCILLTVVAALRQVWQLRIATEPDENFDHPTDHLPKGEAEGLVRIPLLENIQEGTIPLVVKDRLAKESQADRTLRFLGNRALIQFGERLRNLLLFGSDFLAFETSAPANERPHGTTENSRAKLFRQRFHDLAPWLKGDPTQDGWPMNQFPKIQDTTSRAIVVCAGDKQFAYLDALLHTIRLVHHSNMAVYVTFRGDVDFSPESRKRLSDQYSYNGRLEFINLVRHFDMDGSKLQGWNMRIFGLLAVPEAQVALLDVDVLLLRPPEDLFDLKGFREVGAHFFHDRTAPDKLWSPKEFLLRLQPQPSQTARSALTNGNWFNEHIQESGVVLLDKIRRYRGLWAACLLVGRWDIRRFAQRTLVYGDKEFYWTAFETINEPYAFSRYYPGVIGDILTNFNDDDQGIKTVNNFKELATIDGMQSNMALCGRLLHLDDFGVPLWANGGYLTKEDDRQSNTAVSRTGLKPSLFVDGGDSQRKAGLNQNWRFHEGMGVTCLYPNSRGVRQVPEQQTKKATAAVNHYLQHMAFSSV